MQEWVASAQQPNAIGLQARQAPAVQYVKDLLAEGYVGKVLSANLKISIDGMVALVTSRLRTCMTGKLEGTC